MEDNIKKFEGFLDRMQGLLDNAKKQGHIIVRVEDLENAFPELKESEDEKVKRIIHSISNRKILLDDETLEVKKVVWIDSCASNSYWCFEDGIKEAEPIEIASYGVLVKESDEYIVLAQNFGVNPRQVCNLMTIPKGCIKEIINLETLNL